MAAPAAEQTFNQETRRLGRELWGIIRSLFRRHPYESGLACCIAGTALLILSYARILIVGPVLIGGLIGGAITMLRGRVLPGLAICAASIFVPAIIWSVVQWISRLVLH